MKFTILGSTGFIGGALVRHLRSNGIDVDTSPRDIKNLQGKNLGHVIYAIGMTGNFRQQPDATIEAHVNVLRRLMDGATFDSWLYLSSARVYSGLPAGAPATEDAVLPVRPDADGLYDLSKLLGESICLSHKQETVRVARLSNVYGAGQSEHTFLGSILRDLSQNGKTTINQSPESSKDYISIDDVVEILKLIATQGKERIYNVASGRSVTHRSIADSLGKSGYKVEFSANAPTRIFPPADPGRVKKEFGKTLRALVDDLPGLLETNTKVNHEKIRK